MAPRHLSPRSIRDAVTGCGLPMSHRRKMPTHMGFITRFVIAIARTTARFAERISSTVARNCTLCDCEKKTRRLLCLLIAWSHKFCCELCAASRRSEDCTTEDIRRLFRRHPSLRQRRRRLCRRLRLRAVRSCLRYPTASARTDRTISSMLSDKKSAFTGCRRREKQNATLYLNTLENPLC